MDGQLAHKFLLSNWILQKVVGTACCHTNAETK